MCETFILIIRMNHKRFKGGGDEGLGENCHSLRVTCDESQER